MGQMDLTDIHRKVNPMASEYIFFLRTNGTLFRKDYVTEHKTSPSEFKKIKIIPVSFWSQCYQNQNKGKTGNSQICGNLSTHTHIHSHTYILNK